MIWHPMPISGVFRLEPEPHEDERGFFARCWCEQEASAHGITVAWRQANLSVTRRRGSLRGLHYSVGPRAEAKLVRCTRGRIFDVVVDVRRDSASFGGWCATELSAENRESLFVPIGCGHGFQSLEDDCEVCYQMGACYDPAAQRGLRWNDPAVGIAWPLPVTAISARDTAHPLLAELAEEPL